MATIPQAVDFGARPSLRSSRLDVPGSGELALADSLANAAETFAKVMLERQGKKDAIEYANNKSLHLAEDIRLRGELAERQDYENFNDFYRAGMKTHRETLTFRSKHDSAIFDADANLTVERGAVAVAEIGRKLRIDEEKANLLRNLDQSQRDILKADRWTANDHLQTALDGITAAEDAQHLTDVEAEKMRQDFASQVAVASLAMIDPIEREEALKISIAKNPSRDDIKAGKGSGSLADFLHQDEKIEMLRKAQLENKTTRDREKGFAVADEAFELFPLATQGKERQKYVRDNAPDADSRAVAQTAVTSRNTDMFRADQQMRLGIMRGAATMIDEGNSYEELPASELARLSAGERNTLKTYYQQHLDQQEFATRTNWNEWGRWMEMSDQQKMAEDLTSPFWKTTVDGPTWRSMVSEQEQITSAAESARPTPLDTGLTNMQMLDSAAIAGGIYPATGRSDPEDARRNALRFSFDSRITDKSAELGKKLTNQERKKELAEMLMDSAFVDRDFFTSDYDPDEALVVAGMTPSQLREAYLPLSEARKDFVPIDGQDISAEQILRNLASSAGYDPTDQQLERAYFLLRQGANEDTIKAALAGTVVQSLVTSF